MNTDTLGLLSFIVVVAGMAVVFGFGPNQKQVADVATDREESPLSRIAFLFAVLVDAAIMSLLTIGIIGKVLFE